MTDDSATPAGRKGGSDRPTPAADESDGGASQYVETEGFYAYVAGRLGGPSEWALSPHTHGHHNETLFLVWDDRQFVVRRPPIGGPGEGDILVEYRVLEALDDTVLPTPRPVLSCEDESVAGTPFTVVERLDGDVLRHGEPVAYAAASHRADVAAELVDTLALIHDLDPATLGLDGITARVPDAEDPVAGLERQIETWRTQFDCVHTLLEGEVPWDPEQAEDLLSWLDDRVPDTTDHQLVHGDYGIANVLFSRSTPPDLVGVLDWERAGAGDPLVDLGWLLATWFDEPDEVTDLPVGLVPQFSIRSGYPDRQWLIDRYEEQTGQNYENDAFYRTFATVGLAAGFATALTHGWSVDPDGSFGQAVTGLLDRATAIPAHGDT